jgi:hypothetical protein
MHLAFSNNDIMLFEYRRHIAGSIVINSKNPCQNNLEIIDLKS